MKERQEFIATFTEVRCDARVVTHPIGSVRNRISVAHARHEGMLINDSL